METKKKEKFVEMLKAFSLGDYEQLADFMKFIKDLSKFDNDDVSYWHFIIHEFWGMIENIEKDIAEYLMILNCHMDIVLEMNKRGIVHDMIESQTLDYVRDLPVPAVQKNIQKSFDLLIKNVEKKIVTGIVLTPDFKDGQGDTFSADVIEEGAWNFLANRRSRAGFMHRDLIVDVDIVESYIAPISFELNHYQVPKGTWIVSFRVNDEGIWNMVKSGQIRGFSPAGIMMVE